MPYFMKNQRIEHALFDDLLSKLSGVWGPRTADRRGGAPEPFRAF